MKKKTKRRIHHVLFSPPDVSPKDLIAFVLFRLIKIEAELGAIKELITPNISEEKQQEVDKLSKHYYDEAMKIYEGEAEAYYRSCQQKPSEN